MRPPLLAAARLNPVRSQAGTGVLVGVRVEDGTAVGGVPVTVGVGVRTTGWAQVETNTSARPFRSPEIRSVASDWNATKRPSALMEGASLPLSGSPAAGWLMRRSPPVRRSLTKIWATLPFDAEPRFVAHEMKAA